MLKRKQGTLKGLMLCMILVCVFMFWCIFSLLYSHNTLPFRPAILYCIFTLTFVKIIFVFILGTIELSFKIVYNKSRRNVMGLFKIDCAL